LIVLGGTWSFYPETFQLWFIKRIFDAFLQLKKDETSKVFPNDAFGYWKITVERPLRLKAELTDGRMRTFRKACADAGEPDLLRAVEAVSEARGSGPHMDFNMFAAEVGDAASALGLRMTAKRQKLLMLALGEKDSSAEPVIRKTSKRKVGADAKHDSLYGSYHTTCDGKDAVVEYEPDTELRDTEQVPFLEDGGIEAFFHREVLPHAHDTWIDASKTAIGYEISFTRHFYKPQPLRTLDEIETDIRALEKETEGLLEDVLVGGQ